MTPRPHPRPVLPVSDAAWAALLEAHGLTKADHSAQDLEVREGETLEADSPACGRRVRARVRWGEP